MIDLAYVRIVLGCIAAGIGAPSACDSADSSSDDGADATSTGDETGGPVETEDDYIRFMDTIVPGLVMLLNDLDSGADSGRCSGGGSASIDRSSAQMTFSACNLGGITLAGSCVMTRGVNTDTQRSAYLSGADFQLGGKASGAVEMQLALIEWQVPTTQSTTTYNATFLTSDGLSLCVQSSGKPCS